LHLHLPSSADQLVQFTWTLFVADGDAVGRQRQRRQEAASAIIERSHL
jgi:hypothetical protein